MRPARCTIDSSCVVALQHLGLLPQLSMLFSTVLVPKAVRAEISKRRSGKDQLKMIFDEYSFFKRCDDFEKGAIDFLIAERRRERSRDRGEVEAVVQASHAGATVIVDDQWGRKLAANYALECHGTFWILLRLHELRLFASSDLRRHFLTLRGLGIRLPWVQVDISLQDVGEEPLPDVPS